MRALKVAVALLLATMPAFAAQPRFPNPDSSDQTYQNDLDLYSEIKRRTPDVVVINTASMTLSDGTNSFTVGGLEAWRQNVGANYYLLTVCGTFTTGGTVTDSKLRISGLDFTIDTTGSFKGASNGFVFVNSGSDPRSLQSPAAFSTTAIELSRSNGAAWSTGTVYTFSWTGLVPFTR